MVRPVSKSQLLSWLEGGKEFVYALESELEHLYQESSDTFVSGNPTLTHEIKAKLIGRERLLLELIALFEQGDVEVFFNSSNDFIVIEERSEPSSE